MKAPALILYSLLLASPVALSQQTNCTKHIGGVISCTGPNGYRAEAREHINGQASYYDSTGAVGTVTKITNGGVNVSPSVVGRSAPPPGVMPYVAPDGGLNVGSRMVEPSHALRGLGF